MSLHYKLDDVLSDADRPACLDMALNKSTTLDKHWWWLRQRGYKVSRTALHNWRRHQRRAQTDPIVQLTDAIRLYAATVSAEKINQIIAILRG